MTLLLRLWKDGNPAGATERPFDQEVVGIGRDPGNVLQLRTLNVSKNHARIERRGNDLYLTDLTSRNGTYLNGVKIPPEDPRRLVRGDSIRICDFVLEVAQWDHPAVPSDTVHGPQGRENPPGHDVEAGLRAMDGTVRLNHQPGPERSGGESEALNDGPAACARLRAFLEVVIEPLRKIMAGRLLFRSEFTGTTVVRNPELEAVSKQNGDAWVRFFLDARLSEEAAQDRLDLLRSETSEVIPHVIGLLEGYRKSVDAGTKQMLQQLDPSRIREELVRKPLRVGPFSIPYKFLPLVADRIAWRAIERRHHELQEEDRGVLEQRFFRPAFIQGYNSCVASVRGEPLPPPARQQKRTKEQL